LKLDKAKMSFKQYLQRVLLHYRSSFRRADGRTPAEHIYGRSIRVPLTKGFLFGESLKLKQEKGKIVDALYLMQRSQNTAWVIDKMLNELKLAHMDQIAPSNGNMENSKSSSDVMVKEEDPINSRPKRLTRRPTTLQYFKKGG